MDFRETFNGVGGVISDPKKMFYIFTNINGNLVMNFRKKRNLVFRNKGGWGWGVQRPLGVFTKIHQNLRLESPLKLKAYFDGYRITCTIQWIVSVDRWRAEEQQVCMWHFSGR